eukprot:1862053-Amphidinium_carterae.1
MLVESRPHILGYIAVKGKIPRKFLQNLAKHSGRRSVDCSTIGMRGAKGFTTFVREHIVGEIGIWAEAQMGFALPREVHPKIRGKVENLTTLKAFLEAKPTGKRVMKKVKGKKQRMLI